MAHRLVPYSRTEHALYGLNERPSDIEVGLDFESYQLRRQLDSQTFMSGILQSVGQASGISAIINYIFGKDDLSNSLQIKYCMHEEYEQAQRQLTLLKLENPEEAEKIFHSLNEFPSFEEKIKRLDHLKTISLEEVELEEAQGQKYSKDTKEIVRKVRGVAAKLGAQLCKQYEQFSSLKNPFYKALVEEIISSSIESQDYLIEWANNHPKELEEFILEFAQQTDSKAFFDESSIQSFEDNINLDGPLKTVNKTTIKNFVACLMNTGVQQYIENDKKIHAEKHEDSIASLSSKSLTERMDLTQIVRLHKRLMSAENQSFFEMLPSEVRSMVLHLLDDEVLIKLAKMSPEFFQLCSDILDERKVEKIFSLKELEPEENVYFNKNRHDILLMEAAYRELKLNHLGYTLFEILKERLAQTNTLKRVKSDCIRQLSDSEDTPNIKEVYNTFGQLLIKNEDYKQVNGMIKITKEKIPGLSDLYNALRELLIEEEAKGVSNDLVLLKGKNLCDYSQSEQNESSGGWFSSWMYNNSAPTLTQEMVNDRFQQAQKKLIARDKSSNGWQSYNLLQVIKEMKFEDHSQLSLKDLIKIHQRILEGKLTKSNEFDRNFVEKYFDDVYSSKLGNPIFRNRLFYGYAELIEAMREHNQRFLKELFDL